MGHEASHGRRGVFVLGMHRSGTSATMRALIDMGLPACRESDFIPGREGNPRGHYESSTLLDIDTELLRRAGGFWWSPPTDAALAAAGRDPAFLRRARERFLDVHGTPQWACKDPLCCLTLPFWERALELAPVVIAVTRNPLEVASSLQRRSRLESATEKKLGLALWERYTRAMLAGLGGRPAFLSDYGDLLADPGGWAQGAHQFLREAGFELPPLDAERVTASLEPDLRHRRIEFDELERDRDLSASQLTLYRAARSMAGAAQAWPSVALPPLDPTMERTLRRVRRRDVRLRARVRRAARRVAVDPR